jgi:flagellar biosynthesis/type III secretory pathway protein FliH
MLISSSLRRKEGRKEGREGRREGRMEGGREGGREGRKEGKKEGRKLLAFNRKLKIMTIVDHPFGLCYDDY